MLAFHAVNNTSYVGQGKAPCDKDTRIDVLKEILDWVEDTGATSQNFFWLTGDPGCGKSAITASTARVCKDKDYLWAQFFINRNNYDTTNPNAYFPSIARQFATRSEDVEYQIYKNLKAKPSLVDSMSSDQAASLFIDVIRVASRANPLKPVVVIIDGLDETDRGHLKSTADIFSQLFATLSEFPNTKVFISSRTEDDIRNPFARTLTNTHVKHLHLDTGSKSSINDVSKFLRRRIVAIVADNELNWNEWPGDERMDMLAARASGLFIWAVTVAKFIQEQIDSWGKECLDVLLDKLNSDGMTDMNNLYGLILELSYRKFGDEWAFECFRRIVGTIVVLQEPLCIDDISALLNLRRTPTSPPVDIIKFVKRLRTVLVTGTAVVNDRTIPRLHKSFYEYITDDNRVDKPFHVSLPDSHQELSLCCLQQLATAKSVINSTSLPAVFCYATKFWSSHFPNTSGPLSGMALVKTNMTPGQFEKILQFSTNATQTGPIFLHYSLSRSLIRASLDNQMRSWKISIGGRGRHVPTLRGHTHSVRAAKYSPDGSHILSCSWDMDIRLWNAEEYSTISPVFERHTDLVHAVDFSPDGQYIVSSSQDKTVTLWNARTGIQIGSPFEGHTDAVTSVAFSPTGDEVISGSADKTIRRWSIQNLSMNQKPLTGHTSWVGAVIYSPDGTTIASCSGDRTIRLWDTKTGEPIGSPLFGHTKAVTTIAYSPDGTQIISGSADMTIRFWDVSTRTQSGPPLWGHTGGILSVAFSPKGKHIVSSSSDGTIRLWNRENREPVGPPMTGHSDWVRSVSFSPDGDKIVSSSDDQTIRIWDMPIESLFGAAFTSFSPRGSQTLSASPDHAMRLWNSEAKNPNLGLLLNWEAEEILSVTFSLDGTRIAAASSKSIYVWDSIDGRLISCVSQSDILSVAFKGDTNDLLVTHKIQGQSVLKEVDGQFKLANSQDHSTSPKEESTLRSSEVTEGADGFHRGDVRWFPSVDPDAGLSAYIDGHIIRAKKNSWVVVVPAKTEYIS